MKIKNTIVICIIISCVELLVMTNYTMATEYYLAPTSAYFEVYSWDDHDFKLSQKINFEKIDHFAWPNCDKSTGDVYFEGENIDSKHKTSYIYKFNIDNPAKLKLVLEGRYPALSTDGKLLVYYQHPNQLWLLNLKNEQIEMIVDDMLNYRPPVWISPNRLLYYSNTRQLILLDILTKEKRVTGHEKIVPGALSPDGKTVLCSDARKIYIYSIDTNKIETIKETKFLSIGSDFIWRPDGKSFFYWRQTWAKQLQLQEGYGSFLFSLEDKTEKQLAPFGGSVFIGNNFNPR
ncbi:MAG: hypothetical protein APR62_01645 [Smithella sp. SDB]|nr:MAG: hypothetical protein APR62_01645 [Smithella sp. SDB]